MKANAKKTLVSITLLFIVALSLCTFIEPASAEANNSVDGTSEPSVDFTDFQNGTTLTIIDYRNGTKDVISETMQMKTAKLQLGQNTVNQLMSAAVPTSTEESTGYVTVTQDAVLEQEVLMGFTYQLVAKRYEIVDLDVLVAYARAGIDVDIGFGLRLPIRITLEYPEQMTVEHDYELYATLSPLDRPSYDEFLCKFKAQIWVEAGIWVPVVGWTRYSDSWGPDYDWSKSFATPLGPEMEFPISPLEILVWDFWLMQVKVVMDPQLGSDKITARANAGGDAAGEHTITWSTPDQRIPFTVHADDYGPTDFAEIELSDFRYYFTIFKLHFKLKFDFDSWIDWLTGDPTINLFTLDMSWLTEGLYLRVHEGTDGTVDVSVFTKKFGIDLVITPISRDIVPGDIGTYDVLVINRGNVPDTFLLSTTGLPSIWWHEFSSTEVTVDAYGSESVQLSVQPYRHWSTSPGDYSFTVTGTSQEAPLHDLSATDTEVAIVHVLPFYEVTISVAPAIVSLVPGGTAVYTIEVANLGNVLDAFDISLTYADFDGAYRAVPTSIPTAWTTIDKTYMSLDPGVSDTATLTIAVPSDWAGMEDATYDFTGTATSIADPAASDSDSAKLTVQATKESQTRYIGLEIESLTEDIRSWANHEDIKSSLLDKLTNATKKYEQALDYILEGRMKPANVMLKACEKLLSAFIHQVEAQNGKHIAEATADDWIAKAETIISDIETAIATPI